MAGNARRLMMGWDEPLLLGAARRLLEGAPRDVAGIDLSGTLVVVAGRRAARLLTGFLVDLAEARGLGLAPPEIVTPRDLPERLGGGPAGLRADAAARRLAWLGAIDDSRGAVEASGAGERRRLARTLEGWSDDLASAGLRFADAAARLVEAPGEEVDRLERLGVVQRAYEARLGARGLVDPALWAADRWFGDEARGTGAAVTLVGVTELRLVERRALERGAGSVEAFVLAPEEDAERFDELGCVRVEAWAEAAIELDEDRVVFAEDARDQAERALERLARLGGAGGLAADSAAIGATSAGEAEALRRRAADAGVRLRLAPGRAATRTSAGRLIAQLAAHAEAPTLETFTRLLRHPDVERAALDRAGAEAEGWLERLDEIQRDTALRDWRSAPPGLRERERAALEGSATTARDVLGALVEAPKEERSAREWAAAIAGALRGVFGSRVIEDEDESRALDAVDEALEEISRAGEGAGATAGEALAIVLERLEATTLPEAAARDAIETLGWLEMLADPAPHAVVIGMSDDRVPGARAVDGVVAERARAGLGLPDALSRTARDAYLVTALARSRDTTFVCARRALGGDPVRPSRLLLRCSGERLARRVRRFVEPCGEEARARVRVRTAAGDRDGFRGRVLVEEGYSAPDSLRVTDFGVFLRSPARWYLERRLGLEEMGEPARELSAARFGSLAHRALELYGRDEACADLTDADAAARALSAKLDEAAREFFAERPHAAVSLQRELLRRRLGLLGAQLAARRNEGWRVLRVEWKPEAGSARLDVDGAEVGLRGMIDRIEARDGEWAVIDYKTGKATKGVEASHYQKQKRRWIDLQLPLYRLLVAELEPPGAVRLGLWRLPSKEGDGGLELARWDEEELASADEAARGVVRAMRAMRAGDVVDLGRFPPDAGALGWITGERFVRAETDGEDAA